MKHWNFSSIDRSLTQVNQWLARSSLQKLETAYSAAFAIQEIEDKHFDSKSISFDIKKGKITSDYFQVQLHRELAKVRFNLAQFKLGSFWIKHKLTSQEGEIAETESLILEQLSFIESVVAKYRLSSDPDSIGQVEDMPAPIIAIAVDRSTETDLKSTQIPITPPEKAEVDRVQQKTPRSLFRLSQIIKELNPEYEQKVIAELRTQRRQTRTALRYQKVTSGRAEVAAQNAFKLLKIGGSEA
jgi:hypothetical protein